MTPSSPDQHFAKDGNCYETYEDMRAANIKFNQSRLKALGLDKRIIPKVTRTKPVRRTVTPPKEVRRSYRQRKQPPELLGLTEADFATPVRHKKKARKMNHALTPEQREKLEAVDWLDAMEDYLMEEEGVSVPNCKSVMRQVGKLVSGAGVTYARWNDGVVFLKGQEVKLSDDFVALYNEAVNFESEHGADLGNGWLLRHPIKKLENFQQYYHNQTVAASP